MMGQNYDPNSSELQAAFAGMQARGPMAQEDLPAWARGPEFKQKMEQAVMSQTGRSLGSFKSQAQIDEDAKNQASQQSQGYDPLETSYHSQIRQAALADDQSYQMAGLFTPPPGQGTPQPGGTAPGSSRFQENPLMPNLDARYRPRQDRGAPRRTEGASTR
jgi:hypothetical protein